MNARRRKENAFVSATLLSCPRLCFHRCHYVERVPGASVYCLKIESISRRQYPLFLLRPYHSPTINIPTIASDVICDTGMVANPDSLICLRPEKMNKALPDRNYHKICLRRYRYCSSPTLVNTTMVKMTQLEDLNNPSPTAIAENNSDTPNPER